MSDYLEGAGCTCYARNSTECACDADWTPKEVYDQAKQIQELQGQVVRLREMLVMVRDVLSYSDIDCLGSASEGQVVWPVRDEVIMDITKRLNEAPSTSLNEIKAGAIEEAADSCAHMTLDGRICYQAGLHEYAKQLREGE